MTTPMEVLESHRTDPLDKLEAVIEAQRHLTIAPWQPVTDYSWEARRQVEEPHAARIIEAFKPQRVLDVGCGRGYLMTLLQSRGVSCLGMDRNAQGYEVLSCDIGGAISEAVVEDWSADVVVCREVLEHLTIVGLRNAVTNLCTLSSQYVYVTTRFCPSPSSPFDIATSDDLDPTHITMLTQDFLRALFVLEGFKRCRDKEQILDWQHKNRVLVYERVA